MDDPIISSTGIANKRMDILDIVIIDINKGVDNLSISITDRNGGIDNPGIKIADVNGAANDLYTGKWINKRAKNPSTSTKTIDTDRQIEVQVIPKNKAYVLFFSLYKTFF